VALPDLRVTSNADEGLQLFTQWNPHVVFLDLELRPALGRPPASTTGESRNASGYDLAHQFLERDPNVKVVVCSASDPLDGPLQGLVRSGAVESMVKPVVAARVLELLEKIGAAPAPSRDRSERRRR
jgi:DNA-binding NtrC family response regulator